MEVESDKEMGSGAHFAEYIDDITQRPVNQDTSASKEIESANPTANGARVSTFHTVPRPSMCSPSLPEQYPLTLSSSPCSPDVPACPMC